MVGSMKFALIKEKINKFLYSDYYLYTLAIVAFISWLLMHFTALPFYYFGYSILLIATIISFVFADDVYPFTPIVLFGMVIVDNSTGLFDHNSIPMALYVVALIYILLLVGFIIKNKTNILKAKLRNSYLVMGVISIPVLFVSLSGKLGFTEYLIPFALLAYALVYMGFVTGHKVNHDLKKHAMMILILIAIITVMDMIIIILQNRGTEYNVVGSCGWTNRNVGVISINFAVGGAFYLLSKKNNLKGVIVDFVVILFLTLGVILTTSRGGLLIYALTIIPYIVYTYKKIDKSMKKTYLISLGVMGVCLIGAAGVFHNIVEAFIYKIFEKIHVDGEISAGRFAMWQEGFNRYTSSIKNILIGEGMRVEVYEESNIPFIYMYHNAILQMLFAGGIVGIILYLYNLGETSYFIFKNRKSSYGFYALILFGGMFIHSMVDNLFISPTYMLSLFILLMGLENDNEIKENEIKPQESENV